MKRFILLLTVFFLSFAYLFAESSSDDVFDICLQYSRNYDNLKASDQDQLDLLFSKLKQAVEAEPTPKFEAFTSSNREFRMSLKVLKTGLLKKGISNETKRYAFTVSTFSKNFNDFVYPAPVKESVTVVSAPQAAPAPQTTPAPQAVSVPVPAQMNEPSQVSGAAPAAIKNEPEELPRRQHHSILWFLLIPLAFIFLIILWVIKKHHDKNIARQIYKAREDERQRISNELHDTVAQSLKSMQLKQTDSEISDTADQCVKEIRSICYNLMPPDINFLDEPDSFKNVVSYLCKNFNDTTSIKCIFSSDEVLPQISDKETFTNLFRIVQEALNNIQLHSKATQCSIVLRNVTSNKMVIYITDNGTGIDEETLKHGKENHFGLHSMKNRASLINAKLEITSSDGDGTQIRIAL